LVYLDRIVLNFWKLLENYPVHFTRYQQSTDLLQGNHPEIRGGI